MQEREIQEREIQEREREEDIREDTREEPFETDLFFWEEKENKQSRMG
jgi:hypothetical protein